jgi:hypothetical protein
MKFLRVAELKEPVKSGARFRIRRVSYRSPLPPNPTGSWGGGLAEPWIFNINRRVAPEGAEELWLAPPCGLSRVGLEWRSKFL